MKRKYWGIGALVVVLAVIVGLMVTGWSPSKSHQKPIRVVTSLNFYGEVAKAVAGDHGTVTSFINSSAVEPHEFQPTTKQAKQVAIANVAIENGLGYDAWMSKMVKADSKNKITLINVGEQVAKEKDGANEHVWYRPATMSALATTLAKQFSKLDPDHKADYEKNAKAYQAKLQKLDKVIAQAKQNVGDNRLVDVSEPVFDYALENLGYQINDQHFEKAVEDDSDPSPKDIQQIQDDITNHRITFFVNNSQESGKTVENLVKLAKENNVPVLNVTESEPDGEDYVSWMTKQYQALLKIQRGE
ncbi:zinc ABC transporter solute-binding protein [Limosilactobacillus fermentum]|uniref:Metal ABC transporter substrate-binding protein n=1 Tax=Limosilactobacillus fermentum TaxID=1613 RepID=A0A1L7GUQ7_LIMFE|nr:zinc ABC transporter substrate-binding protein [Limosilactobacillus fermentum]APU45683.1 metal ABC transporter substrate-binding protein [Limosilactobacillus fermentum]MDR7663288.1 zinc ABC transporter substrate-binding protein [Limosilactobacillus fermentum]QAR22749.1 metal ABC transporter substrate-binding protein [Limosilactobacillus fermentum]GIC73208.1 metal ABC transporter substrate-binding protein [Limosilactobacillus fermentum]